MEVNQIIKHLKYHYSINKLEDLTAKKQNGKRGFFLIHTNPPFILQIQHRASSSILNPRVGGRFVVCDTNAVSAILFRPWFESHQTLLFILASTFLRKTTDIFKRAAGKHTVSMKCMSTYLVKHFRLTAPSAHLLTWFFLLFYNRSAPSLHPPHALVPLIIAQTLHSTTKSIIL